MPVNPLDMARARELRSREFVMDVMPTSSSPTEGAEYWRARARKVGHTGWKQPVLYAYDQRQRLRMLEQRLRVLGLPAHARVLDFGCGTGDFSRLLLRLGFDVVGYDPYLAPQLTHPRFSYLGSPEAFSELQGNFALVLSVTVLDHVLEPSAFAATLARLRALAAPGGKLLALEYAPDEEAPSPAPHQAYRSLPTWRAALPSAGWELTAHWPVPHPVHAPSQAFKTYRGSLLTRAVNRGTRYKLLEPATTWALGALAQRALDTSGDDQPIQSPLKLMYCSAVEREPP